MPQHIDFTIHPNITESLTVDHQWRELVNRIVCWAGPASSRLTIRTDTRRRVLRVPRDLCGTDNRMPLTLLNEDNQPDQCQATTLVQVEHVEPGCPGIPLPPTTVTIGTVTPTSIALTWEPITGATSYIVKHKINDDEVLDWEERPTTDTNLTITGLTPNTPYILGVTAQATPPPHAPANTTYLETVTTPTA